MKFDDGSAFLELAKTLLNNTTSSSVNADAFYRTVTSRAYYAAFLSVRSYLLRKGIALSNKSDVHSDVQKEILNLNQRKVSVELKRLRGYRNKADYDISYNANSYDTEQDIIDSEKILSIVNNLP